MRPLPHGGLPPQVFAQMTRLPPSRLRYYADHGLLVPAEVDPLTGRRRYRPRQVADGRLLGALVSTGMPVRRAAAVVARADRPAVLAHLAATTEALILAREHLPAPGPDQVHVARGCSSCLVLDLPLAPDLPLLDQLRLARAALAVRLDVPVPGLPRWSGAAGMPDGPRVRLLTTDRGLVPDGLLLPWPPEEPTAPGERVTTEGYGAWAAAHVRDVDDEGASLACLAEDGEAQRVLRAFLDSRDGGFTVERQLLFDALLVRVDLAAAFSPW